MWNLACASPETHCKTALMKGFLIPPKAFLASWAPSTWRWGKRLLGRDAGISLVPSPTSPVALSLLQQLQCRWQTASREPGLVPRAGNRAQSCSSERSLKWVGRHALKVPLGLPQLQRQPDNYFRHLPWSHICLDEASLEKVAAAGQTEGSSLLFTWLGAGWFLPAQ